MDREIGIGGIGLGWMGSVHTEAAGAADARPVLCDAGGPERIANPSRGGDAMTALRDWSDRVEAVHLKDVRLGVLEGVKAERVDTLTARRRGLFCALDDGDADLERFCAALDERGYEGWVVVEQDRVLENYDGAFATGAAEQERNRAWLRDHAGGEESHGL